MRALLGLSCLMLLGGCAPPELDGTTGGAEPLIRIAHPPPGESSAVQLDAECGLTFPLVVTIDNFEVRAPDREAEAFGGHWHADVDGLPDQLIIDGGELFVDVDFPPGDLTPGAELQVDVNLRDDNHQLLEGFPSERTEEDQIIVVGQGDCPT